MTRGHDLLNEGTRCLLVQTQFSDMSFWNYRDVCKIVGASYPAPPLGLITAAALLPQQWEFRLIDTNVEPLLDEHLEWADLVCSGAMLPQQNSVLALIERVHEYGRPIVLGGPDPTSQPGLYSAADCLVLGEGEVTIPLFVHDLERGRFGGTYVSEERADMADAVVPRFDLIRFRDYLQVGIQYSRGCPFNCEFCDIIELFGRKSRAKTPAQVTKELQALYDLGYRGHVDFVDDNFIGNKRSVVEALAAVREWSQEHRYPFYFSTEAAITLAEDDALLQMMRDVDFRFVFIGIETPSPEVLTAINKRQNLRKSISDAVRKIGSYGMIVNAGFILGFDDESEHTAGEMIECIQDSGICMAMVGKLCALPNTQLTKRLGLEGRLFGDGSGSSIQGGATDIDQTTSGLNFLTARPRLEVLKDFGRVIEAIYSPKSYYERALLTGLNLSFEKKHRPTVWSRARRGRSFLQVVRKQGLNRTTGPLFWKMCAQVIRRNPRGIEGAVNLAAMYVHFRKQAQYIVDLTNQEILRLEAAPMAAAPAAT